ncbi:Trimeric LpxA-like [Phytophthora cactorum]|nr:Trimeric LpxA-like [Phytophthora cactorum]
MASGGGQSPSALAAGLLLCCMATSALTTLMIHLYLHSPASPSKSAPESQKSNAKSSSQEVFENEQESIPALPVNGSTGNKKILDLQALEDTAVPFAFQLDAYFFPDKLKEFDHARLFDGCSNVLAVLDAIHPYLEKFFANNAWMSASTAENTQTTTLQSSTKLDSDGRGLAEEESAVSQEEEEEMEKRRLIVLPDAHVLGGTFDLSEGSIHIGKHVRIEPNVFIKGPAIIGARSTLRSGTYIRGDVIVGRNVVLRGEVKNSVILDDAELCHPGYCGDSICGFKSHFGNQVTTANLSLFPGSNLTIDVDGVRYDTGRKKMGVILGDGSQLGCSSVTDPCTLIQQNTVVYPLTRLRKGIYGSSLLIKNKPMEKGVLEIVPLRPTDNMK